MVIECETAAHLSLENMAEIDDFVAKRHVLQQLIYFHFVTFNFSPSWSIALKKKHGKLNDYMF